MEIFINGVIGWDVFAKDIRNQLKEANGQDVKMLMSSPGGYIAEGLAIANLMRNYSGKIEVEVTGMAASMATYLCMFADKVTVFDNSIFMIHNALGCMCGDYRDMNKYAELLQNMSKMLGKAYQNKTGKDEKEIRKMMDEETYLFGSEIVDEGFADDTCITNKCGGNKEEDKNIKITELKLAIENANDIMRQLGTKDDFEKVAALLPVNKSVSKENLPLAGENKTKEVIAKMTLSEFLKSDPAAQAQYDKDLITAKSDERKLVFDELKAVSNFVGNEHYGSALNEPLKAVMCGTMPVVAFNGVVSYIDMQKATEVKAAVVAENVPDTIAQVETVKEASKDGSVKSEADIDRRIKVLTGEVE